MVPLILFSDDTSGNKSKKWHKFECWYLSLAGLPRHQNARLDNIHFVSCSDSVSALDLSVPIAKELTKLECEGMVAFDALYQEEVLVVAPLMCIVCDNPRASQLVIHLGSTALLHCRICTVSLKQDLLISFNAFYFLCCKGQAKTQPRNHLCTQNKICNAATYDGHQITAN